MAAFEPNRAAFLNEEAILNDRHYVGERPVLVEFLRRLRTATTPQDFFDLHLDLFRGLLTFPWVG